MTVPPRLPLSLLFPVPYPLLFASSWLGLSNKESLISETLSTLSHYNPHSCFLYPDIYTAYIRYVKLEHRVFTVKSMFDSLSKHVGFSLFPFCADMSSALGNTLVFIGYLFNVGVLMVKSKPVVTRQSLCMLRHNSTVGTATPHKHWR